MPEQAILTFGEIAAVAESATAQVIDITTSQQFLQLAQQADSVSPLVADNGSVIGYVKNFFDASNSTYGLQLVSGFTAIASEAGLAYGAACDGVAAVMSTTAGVAGICAALGVGLGVGMYEANPEFWTNVSNALVDAGCTVGGKLVTFVKNGKTFFNEKVIEVVKNALFDAGAYDDPSGFNVSDSVWSSLNMPDYATRPVQSTTELSYMVTGVVSQSWIINSGSATKYGFFTQNISSDSGGYFTLVAWSDSPDFEFFWGTSLPEGNGYKTDTAYTFNGQTVYYYRRGRLNRLQSSNSHNNAPRANEDLSKKYCWICLFGDAAMTMPNINILPNSIPPTITDPVTTTYPDWEREPLLAPLPEELPTPDELPVTPWLPVQIPVTDPAINPDAWPEIETDPAPEYNPQETAQTGELPADSPDISPSPYLVPQPWSLLDLVSDVFPEMKPSDPPSDDAGDTGTIVPIPPVTEQAAASGLISVYNPTREQVNQFAGWLWSTDFIDQILKLFADPMQAIIGFHLLYTTPITGSSGTIHAGYLDSGVPSALVSNQFANVDCGSVKIDRYYNNALDYTPYTNIYCYLPFIGIVSLNADDLIDSTLSINYKVDVLTGTCIAQLSVQRDNMDAVLYVYNGNCAVQLPISSGSFGSLIIGLLSATAGVAGTIMSGGAAVPALMHGATQIMSGKANVSMSGNLGANAGALGHRKPYLIIKRQESYTADNFSEYYGIPSNELVVLGSQSGYTRVKDVNLTDIVATETELLEIERQLKEGIII